MYNSKKADLVIDLQFGSTGKGLICGYLAVRHNYDVVATANMPNAGHTFIDGRNNKMIHKVLPNGVVSPSCRVALIGPGAVFSMDRLKEEMATLKSFGYGHFMVGIHQNAVPLMDRHKESERKHVKIGSTMQGSGAAMVDKIMRDPDDVVIARDVALNLPTQERRIRVLSTREYRAIVKSANRILLEGAQGFSLGINEQFYPYCTSRDCTPARFLADMAMPHTILDRVIGAARVHPIRVGSPDGGYSGDSYPDQREMTWEELGVGAERTTVTDRVRRVFSYSKKQIEDAIDACHPDEIFLNFCNYDVNAAHSAARHMMALGPSVAYTGWGPGVNDVHGLSHLINAWNNRHEV